MYAELDKKWGVVPPDTINADEDGWTDVDVARDFAPGGALYDWAMERMHKGIAERVALEIEQERARNDVARVTADTARQAKKKHAKPFEGGLSGRKMYPARRHTPRPAEVLGSKTPFVSEPPVKGTVKPSAKKGSTRSTRRQLRDAAPLTPAPFDTRDKKRSKSSRGIGSTDKGIGSVEPVKTDDKAAGKE